MRRSARRPTRSGSARRPIFHDLEAPLVRAQPGVATNRALKSAWTVHELKSFAFRILEEIDSSSFPYGANAR